MPDTTAPEEAPMPCPFCGESPRLLVQPDNAEESAYFAALACYCGGYSACAHKMVTAPTADEAEAKVISAWNTRAALAAAPQAIQPTAALIEECRAALAEELSAWDIDPPLHHVKQAHDKCVAWLATLGAPAPQAQVSDARDADRYRWLRTQREWHEMNQTRDVMWQCGMPPTEVDVAIDAAIKAAEGENRG